MGYENSFVIARNATIGLHHFNGGYPDNSASGCLINYLGKTIILTVAHAVVEGGWGVKLAVVHNPLQPGFIQTYYNAQYTLICQGKPNVSGIEQGLMGINDLLVKPRPIDFAFAGLPAKYRDRVLDEYFDYSRGIIYSSPKHIFTTNLQDVPVIGRHYMFYGETEVEFNKVKNRVISVPKLIYDFEFSHSENEYHIFKLPFIVHDAIKLKGCSGAPIFDENGTLVSLVVSCREKTHLLFGINLNKYKVAIDIDNGLYG
jgi:hypothetical protein